MLSMASDKNIDTVARTVILSTSLIHKVFDYIDDDYKLLIHREGSTDEQRSKILSIELIMRSGLEDYFKGVLLSNRWRNKMCNEAVRRGYVSTLKWAREYGCDWNSDTCSYMHCSSCKRSLGLLDMGSRAWLWLELIYMQGSSCRRSLGLLDMGSRA